MAIRLHIVSGMITSKKMKNAVNEGFENSTKNNIIPIKKEIDEFISVFKDEINKGDIFDMVYVDSVGTKISKNGKLSKTIKGIKFKRSLFGIWLCDEPAQESLKEEMLGKDDYDFWPKEQADFFIEKDKEVLASGELLDKIDKLEI